MDIRRINENDLYNNAKVWLEGYGSLSLSSVMIDGENWYTITLVSKIGTIKREGNDTVLLTISLYNELVL